jgi:peptidyl-prolyl cis-trans isomerase C
MKSVCLLLLLVLSTLMMTVFGFIPSPTTRRPHLQRYSPTITTTTSSTSTSTTTTRLFLDPISMIRHFGKKVTASHILIGPSTSVTGRGMVQEEATAKLLELKQEIGDDPIKFAEAANQYSSCRATNTKGGDLGEFGPGLMVGPFDKVCFEEEVGKVHGPVSTPFGEHLIYIKERS